MEAVSRSTSFRTYWIAVGNEKVSMLPVAGTGRWMRCCFLRPSKLVSTEIYDEPVPRYPVGMRQGS